MGASAAAGGLEVTGGQVAGGERVLTVEALAFVARLHEQFVPRRQELLALREARHARIAAGEALTFLPETRGVREAAWQVAPAPRDLDDRRVEITGPVDRKMMINALNSSAKVFMADLEDATSPTWENAIGGQANLMDAVRRVLAFESPEGKRYELGDTLATLVVRPRGWHLPEAHIRWQGGAASGSLVDFGLYFFHNAQELIARGTGPYFYLPKMESHLEARLWNDVFTFAQRELGIPHGTVRATVLIETILAAFEMEEILHELREHAAGLNAGRWDYLFSLIKTFRDRPDFPALPDRGQLTMGVPFMRAYAELLVRTCHRRGAHAIGGMAAYIPSRKDAEVNERALAKVREDKERESSQGFDGTWVAHPDLVPVAREVFDRVLGKRPNQKDRLREDVVPDAQKLLDLRVEGGQVTREGVRLNVNVALQYIAAWLAGQGAVAIHNLMEDAATAEISRTQLWQWVHRNARLADGGTVSAQMYQEIRDRELASLKGGAGVPGRYDEAAALLDQLVLGEYEEFLTVPGYQRLTAAGS
ncbi:MAG: malate synthase A [Gemmatimonadaceae bacterium]